MVNNLFHFFIKRRNILRINLLRDGDGERTKEDDGGNWQFKIGNQKFLQDVGKNENQKEEERNARLEWLTIKIFHTAASNHY